LLTNSNGKAFVSGQIQDIAGCRLVVTDVLAQQRVVDELSKTFDKVAVVDRRERPSHGYRAVHVIVSLEGTSIEIQVRTTLKHLWAELSEKLSDLVDPAIKYGGGAEVVRSHLADTSSSFRAWRSWRKGLPLKKRGLLNYARP